MPVPPLPRVGDRVQVQRSLPPERRTGWRRLMDWSLRRRVLAVVAIPVVAAVALGGVRMAGLVAASAAAEADAGVSRAQRAAADLVAAVGDEQLATAAGLVAVADGTREPAAGPADLGRARAATDTAAERLDRAMTAVLDPGEDVRTRARSVTAAVDRLDDIRTGLDSGLDSGLGGTPRGAVTARAVRGMTEVGGAALRLGDALAAELVTDAVRSVGRDGQALVAAHRQHAAQDALALVVVARPGEAAVGPAELRSAETARLAAVAEFRDAAAPDQVLALDAALASDAVAARAEGLQAVTAEARPAAGPVSPGPAVSARGWLDLASSASASAFEAVRRSLQDRQVALADARQRGRLERAAAEAAALAALLGLGFGVTVLAARSILLPLRRLRADAIMIAEERLPAAIERIRGTGPDGRDGADVGDIQVHPVDVRTTEEIGQVARAFDAVHVEAVRLAADQEQLRRNVNDLFVNLSRRSQALVERQLALIDRLENDEADPDQLAQLFRLDHLAARMRRNNDNLMVLAG
ncbi:MAG: nitrate- and nitrite sensing domain-containing protein, partial [Kineosporiaceae bacterium]